MEEPNILSGLFSGHGPPLPPGEGVLENCNIKLRISTAYPRESRALHVFWNNWLLQDLFPHLAYNSVFYKLQQCVTWCDYIMVRNPVTSCDIFLTFKCKWSLLLSSKNLCELCRLYGFFSLPSHRNYKRTMCWLTRGENTLSVNTELLVCDLTRWSPITRQKGWNGANWIKRYTTLYGNTISMAVVKRDDFHSAMRNCEWNTALNLPINWSGSCMVSWNVGSQGSQFRCWNRQEIGWVSDIALKSYFIQ